MGLFQSAFTIAQGAIKTVVIIFDTETGEYIATDGGEIIVGTMEFVSKLFK